VSRRARIACGAWTLALLLARDAHGVAPSTEPHDGPRAPRIVVSASRGASARLARGEADRVVAAVDACVAGAWRDDPVGMSTTPRATAVIRLRRDGHADTVDISPSRLPHGLSACLASALLSWQQGGIVGPRPTVELGIDLGR
jgi:hypothetical protein